MVLQTIRRADTQTDADCIDVCSCFACVHSVESAALKCNSGMCCISCTSGSSCSIFVVWCLSTWMTYTHQVEWSWLEQSLPRQGLLCRGCWGPALLLLCGPKTAASAPAACRLAGEELICQVSQACTHVPEAALL